MQDSVDAGGKCLVRLEPLQKFVFVYVIGNRQVGNVDEFVAVAEVIDDDHVIVPIINQCADEIAAYESGASGNYVHAVIPDRRGASVEYDSNRLLAYSSLSEK